MKKIIKFFLQKVPRKYLQKLVLVFKIFAKLFYLGNKKECPVCGKHYRKFLPYGYVISRENALCPNCLSLERHRLLWLYFKKETKLFEEKNAENIYKTEMLGLMVKDPYIKRRQLRTRKMYRAGTCALRCAEDKL